MTKPLPEVFYKYTTLSTARVVLEKGTLRWSTPASFNDPKILCQSDVPDNLLMWAYYAEQHKGVVLCFRAHAALDSPWRIARPVVYSREIPRLCDVEFLSDMSAGLAVLDAESLIDAAVYTKAAEWAHEQEWRLQAGDGRHPKADYEDIPFHPQVLDAVIFGCVTPQSDREALTALVRARYPHAKIRAARKDDRQFRLIIEEVLA